MRLVTNSTAASLIEAKHTNIPLISPHFLLRAFEYQSLIHWCLEIVTVLRTEENPILVGVCSASLQHFTISRFCMTILHDSMIPSICKNTEIKSFVKVTEELHRMRTQTYSPFQAIILFTEDFIHLIYHHSALNCWLATEGLWESFQGSQDLCCMHHPSIDSQWKMAVSAQRTDSVPTTRAICRDTENWESQNSLQSGGLLCYMVLVCLPYSVFSQAYSCMSPWWSGLM